MTAKWRDIQLKEKTFKGFGPDTWILNPKKMITLETKGQKLKN